MRGEPGPRARPGVGAAEGVGGWEGSGTSEAGDIDRWVGVAAVGRVAGRLGEDSLPAVSIKIVEPHKDIIIGINRIFSVATRTAQDKRMAPVAREVKSRIAGNRA